MKNNYPIKYAAMPIIEQTGWYPGLHELEREYGIVCYIVSKCYVVGREEKYNRYGNTICEYKVVFSYGKDNQYGGLSRVEPEFCLMNGRCNNSTNVDKVFDSFEEAKEETEKKNKEILSKELSFIRVDDNFNQNVSLAREKHEEVVNYYQEIESMIEENSTDLVVNDKVKEQSVIFERNNSWKKIEYSLYDMIRLYSDEDFIAYNVSLEDYKKIEEQLKNGQEVDIEGIKRNRLLTSYSDDKKVFVISNNSIEKSCFYIENGSLYYYDRINYFLNAISRDSLVIYTIETYDDVINSYITDAVINEDMPKNEDTEKVFRKVIKLR